MLLFPYNQIIIYFVHFKKTEIIICAFHSVNRRNRYLHKYILYYIPSNLKKHNHFPNE